MSEFNPNTSDLKWYTSGALISVFSKKLNKVVYIFDSFQDAYDFLEVLPGYDPDNFVMKRVEHLIKLRPW